MAGEDNIKVTTANTGLVLDRSVNQIPKGKLTMALNAVVESFDGNGVSYQKEMGNKECVSFPEGYLLIGKHPIYERNLYILFLTNPTTGIDEIGKIDSTSCKYSSIITAPLGFNINYPIHEVVHKITNCNTEIYWVDNLNNDRYLDIDNPPLTNGVLDINRLSINPDFSIPNLSIKSVNNDGELDAGTYQFSIQYANATSEAYTSFYSVTNPIPIFDPSKVTEDFNYKVGKSITLDISNLDTTGYYKYFNLAVIKTVNNISSVQLVGTYSIDKSTMTVSYTGQNQTLIRLSIDDIFQKYPIYNTSNSITVADDILIRASLVSDDRLSYQSIWNKVSLQWQTHRLPSTDNYTLPLNSSLYRSYMRDEVYAFEGCFLLKNGKQTDGFHIPGRAPIPSDLTMISNPDSPEITSLPYWKVYNTASVSGFEPQWTNNQSPSYKGPYQYGAFSYQESTEVYPSSKEIWGDLAGTPIRHHKFPDSSVTHIHDNQGNIYPIGIKLDLQQLQILIQESSLSLSQKQDIVGFKIMRGNRANNKSIVAKGLLTNVGKYTREDSTYYFPNYLYNDLRKDPFILSQQSGVDSGANEALQLDAFSSTESKQRFTLHSPDTSFNQPFLGSVLKLETVEYGQSTGHFVQIQDHAKYKFLSSASYVTATAIGIAITLFPTSVVVGIGSTGGSVAGLGQGFAAYNIVLDIIEKLIPRKNFAYQYNSVGNYTDFIPVNNTGNKQRRLDLASYATPGILSVGDTHPLNNFQRETSVYIKTATTLPYPHEVGAPQDVSKHTLGVLGNCDQFSKVVTSPISAYYGSLKNNISNQYGQIYSYETIDTGFQYPLSIQTSISQQHAYIFGGDTFINRFAYKSKMPFFIDNRVSSNDDSDVFYNEIGNVGYPAFWFSTDVNQSGSGWVSQISKLFGIKANNFDCDKTSSRFFYQDGKIYLFAYGIPYFYTESQINVDFRQATNNKEGDFYPHISSGIPDQWLQEVNTTILQDNVYTYNETFSKQNKENFFSHLPLDYTNDKCKVSYPFRAVFSETRGNDQNTGERNNWLIYKPTSRFDFPQNYGKLISLTGIENRQVLARFENKSLIYNALLTAPTSQQSVYLGQSLFSSTVPPIDLADTSLGYLGTQNKFIIKTEWGVVTTDAKRGQVFLIRGNQATDLTSDQSGVKQYFGQNFELQLPKLFPTVNPDNNFNGVGIHGTYDAAYNRLIITKIDYSPIVKGITHSNNKFFYNEKEVLLTDPTYFCNKSLTISYNFSTQSWISFHSYIPAFYIGDNQFFYSGTNKKAFIHGKNPALYTHYNNTPYSYIIEYPFSYQYNDEILQCVKDYTKSLSYTADNNIEVDSYFSKAILYNNQQSSGILNLVAKPANNMREYMKYPIYATDSKTITYTKADNFYQINTFWSLIKDKKKPLFLPTCIPSLDKEVNQENMDYSKRSFKKEPLRAKDLKVRLISDDTSLQLVSQFLSVNTQQSYR